jgi:DNA-binding NarL/FixJ family response regulator
MITRVLIGDDHPIVRGGLKLVLEREPDFTVVAEARDGAEAVSRALQPDVDLAILDVSMPRKTGLQAAAELARRRPQVRTLMLSMHDNEQYLLAAVRAGASGYVLKSVVDQEIVSACRAIVRGDGFVFPTGMSPISRQYAELARRGGKVGDELLTPRELEVVKLVAEGHSSRDIAEALVISVKTVERHRANIKEKLGARDRVDLTRYAIRLGLVEP